MLNHSVVLGATSFQDVLGDLGDKIELENYETNNHADASNQAGAKNITSAIFFVVDFIKYTLGTVVVGMIILNSIALITAGKQSEEKITKEKAYLTYAIMGLVLVFVAEEGVKLAFFGTEGEIFRDEETVKEFSIAGSEIIKGVYTMIQVFVGSIAVLALIYSGLQILVAAGSEETVNSAKKRIFMAAIGLIVIGLSETIIKDVVFKDRGEDVGVSEGINLVVSMTNFLSSMIATLAVLAIVYAGFLYILNFGNDEMTTKAKKIIFSAIIGLVLAAAAFGIVSTVIDFDETAVETASLWLNPIEKRLNI